MAKDKRENTGSATSLPQCKSCKRDLGKETGCLPFFVDDSASTPGETAKHEAFCPTCFVYVRSPREPRRFVPGSFIPVKCTKCGLSSVSCGSITCGQCGSRNIIVLPPQPGIA